MLYQSAGHHWAHAEQIRWTLLYNYLMAGTILLLAWAAVFASVASPGALKPALIVFATAGVIVSTLWFGLALRANAFVRAYANLGLKLEQDILGDGMQGPFRLREELKPSLRGLAGWVPTWVVLRAVPLTFAAVFAVLVWLSVFRA